ncbi:transposase [Thermodesulfobacteriota bacterium]
MVLPFFRFLKRRNHAHQSTQKAISEWTCVSRFLKSILWPDGRRCAHCQSAQSYPVSKHRLGIYECSQCKKQFTLTSNTPMHSTKLPL